MANIYPFLAYVFVTTFTPGPNNIMSMSNAMRYGYRRTLKFLSGIVVGFFIVMLASGLLNVAVAGWLPSVEKWLKYLGAVYMLYLAYHILRSKTVDDNADEAGLKEEHADNSFRAGFSMQFLNIKVILYGITVFSLFIINTTHDPVSITLYSAVLALIGFAAISCWAFGGNIFRKALQQNILLFNIVMAGLLVYTAVASLI